MTPAVRFAAGSTLALALLVLGGARLAIELGIDHPQALRFAHEGRSAVGTVFTNRARSQAGKWGSSTVVEVTDAELGWQSVRTAEAHVVGDRVPLVCLTPLRRCAVASEVNAQVARWPLTSGILMSAACVILSSVFFFGSRRRRTESPPRRRV